MKTAALLVHRETQPHDNGSGFKYLTRLPSWRIVTIPRLWEAIKAELSPLMSVKTLGGPILYGARYSVFLLWVEVQTGEKYPPRGIGVLKRHKLDWNQFLLLMCGGQ